MRRKKVLAMGLLSAMAVTTAAGTSVFAAESSGATNFEYVPGQSTGQKPDGTLADWTVDYPVKVVLNDSTVDAASGVNMPFTLLNTSNKQDDYSGVESVTVTLKQHANNDGSNGIKMLDAGTPQDGVVMQLSNGTVITTTSDQEVMTLDSATPDDSLTAYLKTKTGAADGKTYTQTLTWQFSDGN